MGQLFDRMGRVVRAELNSIPVDSERNYLNEGTALVAGGAIAGASIGKVGILAGGAGYSLGAVPLAAAGALTGAALYEALRSLAEGDASSATVAAIGAAAGAATSAAIGGVGVAVGGSAIGVGMASMAAGGAVVGLGLVGLSRLLQQGVDPEKLLDLAIEQMEVNLRNAREAAIDVLAKQILLQRKYDQATAEANKWQQQEQFALQKGDEYSAWVAQSRKQTHTNIGSILQAQLEREPVSAKDLKRKLNLQAAKISEAKTLKPRLKAQIAAAKSGQLQNTVGRLGTSSAMAAFERMEDKVLQMEAHTLVEPEFAGADLEKQFALLEAGGVDEELAAMKAQLLGGAPTQAARNTTQATPNTKDSAVDWELEELKRQLDNLS